MTTITDPSDFIIVGENIHTTRVLLRKNPRIVDGDDGRPSIQFEDDAGNERLLPISEAEKATQEYEEGRIKHVRTAVRAAMEEGDDAEVALDYLRAVAHHQIATGANFLDINVDEVSLKLPEQIAAMRWLTRLIGDYSSIPLSIDSSNPEIIEAGIEAALQTSSGAPMLNSASLERPEALDLAVQADGPVIITAAGAEGMPQNTEERVDYASQMVEKSIA